MEQAQASRNKIAKDIGMAKAKGHDVSELLTQGEKLKGLLEQSEAQLTTLQIGFEDFLRRVPNIPHESVPIGASAEDNREERKWGEPRAFSFKPKDHVDIGEALGGLDFGLVENILRRLGPRENVSQSMPTEYAPPRTRWKGLAFTLSR